MNFLNDLGAKIQDHTAIIGVVGLGYVGLPLLLRFAESGFSVLGLDVDEAKVSSLNKSESYISSIPSSAIEAVKNRIEITTDFTRAKSADALIICVPTPLDSHRAPDLSFVINSVESLMPYMRKGQIISLESTTYPGTTDEELLPRIESINLRVGQDVALIFSPEREDPGNPKFNTQNTPKIVGGITDKCLKLGELLYGQVISSIVPVSSTKVAEMTKLLENIHRAVNIGLVNEMKIISDRMGIDIYEVIRAASTKPFGFVPYWPGPGLGGHCIPIDPFYLTWKAKEFGVRSHFIELAGEINTGMPQWVFGKIAGALNQNSKSVRGSKILVLGISYKKNVNDTRESPAIELLELLKNSGANIDYSDPFHPNFPKLRKHYQFSSLKSIEINSKNISSYDCVLVATDHDSFDYKLIQENAKIIVDTRGVYSKNIENIVNA